MAGFAGLWATDETILAECAGDYAILVPRHLRIAQGTDGAIAAGSWALTSASVPDWETIGLTAGNVATVAVGTKTQDTFAIASASGASLTLRRVGCDAGVGMPPGGASGLTGLTFEVPTTLPQIRENQRQLMLRYGVAADVATAADFTEALVLGVLIDLYGALFRAGASPLGGASGQDDNFAAKLRAYRAEYADAVAVLDRSYGTNLGVGVIPALGLLEDPADYTS